MLIKTKAAADAKTPTELERNLTLAQIALTEAKTDHERLRMRKLEGKLSGSKGPPSFKRQVKDVLARLKAFGNPTEAEGKAKAAQAAAQTNLSRALKSLGATELTGADDPNKISDYLAGLLNPKGTRKAAEDARSVLIQKLNADNSDAALAKVADLNKLVAQEKFPVHTPIEQGKLFKSAAIQEASAEYAAAVTAYRSVAPDAATQKYIKAADTALGEITSQSALLEQLADGLASGDPVRLKATAKRMWSDISALAAFYDIARRSRNPAYKVFADEFRAKFGTIYTGSLASDAGGAVANAVSELMDAMNTAKDQ